MGYGFGLLAHIAAAFSPLSLAWVSLLTAEHISPFPYLDLPEGAASKDNLESIAHSALSFHNSMDDEGGGSLGWAMGFLMWLPGRRQLSLGTVLTGNIPISLSLSPS